MKPKFANLVLALVLVAALFLPLAQPTAAGRCRVITIDTLDENGKLQKHIREFCCQYQGRLYCVTLEEWAAEDE